MSSDHTPLLTANLFVSIANAWDGLEEMMIRLDENGIMMRMRHTANSYSP